jgi:hypothetical protein
MRKLHRLSDSYRFPGFKPKQVVTGIFGDSHARIVHLVRQGEKLYVVSARQAIGLSMIESSDEFAIFPAVILASTWNWRSDASSAGGAGK